MSFLKNLLGDSSRSKYPNGYKITHSSGKTYVKESSGWFNVETGKKLNYKSTLILENKMDFVSDSRGTFIDGHKLTPEQAYPFKGLHLINGKWVNDDRHGVIDDRRQDYLNNLYRNTQKELQYQNSEAESIKGKGFESNKDGVYIDGNKLTPEQAKIFNGLRYSNGKWSNIDSSKGSIDSQTQLFLNKKLNAIKNEIGKKDSESKPGNTQAQSNSSATTAAPVNTPSTSNNVQNNSNKSQETPSTPVPNTPSTSNNVQNNSNKSQETPSSTPVPNTQNEPKAEPVSNSSTVSSPKEETKVQNEPEQKSSTTVPSTIPNGYVYTSGKGNKFMLKNGTWYNLSTKKPVPDGNINLLNTSAQKMIDNFNASSDIKIGDKVFSNKGTEYTYNGTGFVSNDGKLLSGGAAQAALNKLKSQSSKGTTDTPEPSTNDIQSGQSQVQPEPDSTTASTVEPGKSAIDTQPEPSSTGSSSSGNPEPYNAQSIVSQLDNDSADSGDSQVQQNTSSSTPDPQSNNSPSSVDYDKLAQRIKSSPYAKKIVTLLSRGSDMDLLAADILLDGNLQEVMKELQLLNNSNTQ